MTKKLLERPLPYHKHIEHRQSYGKSLNNEKHTMFTPFAKPYIW